MGTLRTILGGIKKCGLSFIKYNYCTSNIIREAKCFIYPLKGSIVQIDPSAKVILKGNLYFNAGKIKNSKAEAYLILDERAVLTIGDMTRVNYGSTVHLGKNAVVDIGSMTTNVGFNLQCAKNIIIGMDCMFGRDSTVFDSSYHPMGISVDSMEINTEPVKIGNHVWVGAHAFIMQGTEIGDGSIIGARAYVRGKYKAATTIMASTDEAVSTGTMWARGMAEEDFKDAAGYYETIEMKSLDKSAIKRYSNKIYALLCNNIPGIDFVNEKELLKNHILDSLLTMQIVALLSEEFEVTIPYYEISAGNFNNVEAMSTLVGRLVAKNEGKKNRNEREITALEPHDDYQVGVKGTLVEYVKAHAELNPSKYAVISEGKSYTYSMLYRYVQKYSNFLQKRGLRRKETVVVKSIQSVEYIIIYLAVHYSGGIITTVEKSTVNNKILDIAGQVCARMIICDSQEGIGKNFIFIDSRKVFDNLEEVDAAIENFPESGDSADILFTTGTTGKSKGVELSHAAVIAGAENISYGCQMRRDTVLVVPNPLSHSNAIKNMGACFIKGCTFYVLDGIADLNAYFNALDYEGGRVATVLPPAAIRTIFQLAKEKLADYVDKLDYLMAATAPLPEPDRETLRALLPKTRLYNHYGCSESSSICIYDFNKYSELKNCVGQVMPHSHAFFVDDDKQEIISSSDNIGLLAVKGDATMKGYFHEPELTREILIEGVIYTKDMGYIDDNGFVYILGRDDDIINVGGLKVSPLEVESVALEYGAVQDCICIGVDDEITGQSLKLLVVAGIGFDIQALRNYIAKRLDTYKAPKQYELVEKIERTYNGKLNRKYYK